VAGNISPAGISSTNAFGTAAVSRGAVNIAPVGISSTNAFGTATVLLGGAPQSITSTGIASTNAFGVTTVLASANITPVGIASTTVFGVPSVSVTGGTLIIAPAGIASTTAFGLAVVTREAAPFVHNPVPPYAGDPQETEIDVPAWIRYREEQWEEGPWVMPPYAWIFPHPAPLEAAERGSDQVHHAWLKTHKRPPGPRRLGDNNHRPQSVLSRAGPTPPIKAKPNKICLPYRLILVKPSSKKLIPR
jgi:hypothetical protein